MEKMYRMKTCLAALGLLLLCGCANVNYEKLSYVSPATGGISFKADGKAKLIVTSKGQLAQDAANSITAILNREGVRGVKVVNGAETSVDYYIFVNVTTGYKNSSDKAPLNKKVVLVKSDKRTEKTNEYYIAEEPGYPEGSGALYASVSIYTVNSLDPLHYFEISSNEGDCDGKVRTNEAFVNKFVSELGSKFSDLTATQPRVFDTAIPTSNVDSSMVKALKSGQLNQVHQRAKEHASDDFDAYIALAKNAKKLKPFRAGLCALYLSALAMEMNNFDIENLRELHRRYYQLLMITDDDGLAEACANALARVEKKAALTGNKI